jgi:hypothetical protein
MGMGKPPGEISVESKMFRAVSLQYEQALAAAAEVLGLHIDEIRTDIRTATATHDVEVACGTLPAGSVVGQILSWSAYRDGRPALVAEEYWTCTDSIPGWDLVAPENRFLVRILVEGVPSLRLDLAIGDLEQVSAGHVAVAMTAVRAIPYVLRAPPGVVVPEVFGAYRWRAPREKA